MDALTLETLDKLIKAAGYHQKPLRVTNEFYSEVRRMQPPVIQGDGDWLPVGTDVVVVFDGTENVKLIDGEWTFVPTERPVTHLLGEQRPDWLGDSVELYLDARPVPFLKGEQ